MSGRVLAVDYGRRRIGLAVSDPLGITAQGMPTVEVRDPSEAVPAIVAAAREKEAETVVLGLPLQLDGREGPAAREVRAFGARLSAALGCEVVYVDERLSTAQADRVLDEMGTRRADRAPHRDRIAAQVILGTYLAQRGSPRGS